MACVKIKTKVEACRLGESVNLARKDLIRRNLGDETFRKYVRTDQIAQMLHQLLAMQFKTSLQHNLWQQRH